MKLKIDVLIFSEIDIQMYIQNLGKHVRWNHLRKEVTAFCH